MSLTESSQDQGGPEGRLQDHNGPNAPDKPTKKRDFCPTVQAHRRTISPLGLLKEDFHQFKEEVLKVFKDGDTKTEPGGGPQGRGPLGLLRQDLNQFKEDITNAFRISSSKETTSSEGANGDGQTSRSGSVCPVLTANSAGVNSATEHLAKQRRGGGASSTPGPQRTHKEEEEEEEAAHWVSLSSGVSLFRLRDDGR